MDKDVPSAQDRPIMPAGTNHDGNLNAHDLFMQKDADGQSRGIVSPPPEASSAAPAVPAHLPDLELVDFKGRAEHLLEKSTPDQRGNYPPADLVGLVQNPEIKGQDAVVAASLYRDYKANIGGGSSSGGGSADSPQTYTLTHYLSVDDVQALATLSPQDDVNAANLKILASAHGFAAADHNHDGHLTLAELNRTPAFQRLVQDVPMLQSYLSAHPRGVSRDDLQEISQRQSWLVYNSATTEGYIADATQKLNEASIRSLYGDKDNPLNSIKITDVKQGHSGDCYFEAVLADQAKYQPENIRDAIKDNQNGTYTVTFKGDPDHPVTVPTPTDTEIALYAATNADGVWPAVMEKAFAQYLVTNRGRELNDGTIQDAAGGGVTESVISLLTGHDAKFVVTPPTDLHDPFFVSKNIGTSTVSSIQSEISQALSEHKLVTLGFSGHNTPPSDLVKQHSYSVVGYSPDGAGGSFQLRNPWGEANPASSKDANVSAADLARLPLMFVVESK